MHEKAVFLCVYISEAHSSDEWPIGKTISFCEQPKTTEKRCEIAKIAIEKNKFEIPMLVDPVGGNFEKKFSPWPMRFFVLKKTSQGFFLSFKAMPENYGYDVEKFERWLENNI